MSVLIATPIANMQVSISFVKSLIATMAELSKRGIHHGYLFQSGCLVGHNRNDMAAFFLNKTEMEYLFFIDSDICWEPQQFLTILDYGHDICAGKYLKRSLPPQWAHSVNALATGFMCIKRCVLDKMWNDYPELKFTDTNGENCALFNSQIVDGKNLADDFIFCGRAEKSGFRLNLADEITVKHEGYLQYHPDMFVAEKSIEDGEK